MIFLKSNVQNVLHQLSFDDHTQDTIHGNRRGRTRRNLLLRIPMQTPLLCRAQDKLCNALQA